MKIPVKSIDYVEIDGKAVRSYNAMFGSELPYKTQSVVGWNLRPDILIHGSPCFTEDALILTNYGYLNINNVRIGDLVLSHDNKWHKVTNVISQGKKEIWEIRGMSFDLIRTTSNHLFYTREMYRKWNVDLHRSERIFKDPKWIACEELSKRHYLGIAVNQEERMPDWNGVECTRGKTKYVKNNLPLHRETFWYLCGRFLGDGWIRNRKERNNNISRAIICCAKDELDDLKNKIGNIFNYCVVEERTVYKLQFPNKELGIFLSQFGRGAENKTVPGFIFDLPVSYLKSFLEGYIDSGGCVLNNGDIQITSTSRKLIYSIAQCVAKVYKSHYLINKFIRPKKCTIEGREVNQRDTYTLGFHIDKRKQDHAFYEDGYIWVPITQIINTGESEYVYDLSVEDAHSFVVNGCIAHNCQSVSICGWISPVGSPKGADEGSGTESSLMWETIHIIQQMGKWKPRVVIWENVKGIRYKGMKENFERYLKEMELLGYTNSHKCLDARDFGIPQARERVFTISCLDGVKFDFEKLRHTQMRNLQEFLQDKVEDNYLVTQPSILSAIGKTGTAKRATVIKDFAYTITERQDRCPAQVIDCGNGKYRFLTELECWRLFGYSDEDYYAAEKANPKKKGAIVNRALYKQAGNSICVPIFEAIFEEIFREIIKVQ